MAQVLEIRSTRSYSTWNVNLKWEIYPLLSTRFEILAESSWVRCSPSLALSQKSTIGHKNFNLSKL